MGCSQYNEMEQRMLITSDKNITEFITSLEVLIKHPQPQPQLKKYFKVTF